MFGFVWFFFLEKEGLFIFFCLLYERHLFFFFTYFLITSFIKQLCRCWRFTYYKLFLSSVCHLTTAWPYLCAVHVILCKCCLIFSQGYFFKGGRRFSKKLKTRAVTMITITIGRWRLLNALWSAVFKNKTAHN